MKMTGMMATASMLQAYRSGMASDYTTVSGISKDDALAAMDKETWYTNEETVDAGFTSKVLGDSEAKASATCSGKFVMAENTIVTALTTPRKKTYALPERVAAVVATLERMADAAGIEVSTINQTLRGTIDCPPRTRLEGFAEEMDISADSLISAAEEDGCTNYSDNDDDDMEARMGGKDKPNPKGDTASQADEQLCQVTEERDPGTLRAGAGVADQR